MKKVLKNKKIEKSEEIFQYSDVENGIFVDDERKKICYTKSSNSVVICDQLCLSKVAIDQNGTIKAIAISIYEPNSKTYREFPLYSLICYDDTNIVNTFKLNNVLIREQHKDLLAKYVEYLYINYKFITNCDVIRTYSGLGFLEKIDMSVDTSTYYTSLITTKDSITEGLIEESLRKIVSHNGDLNQINNFLIKNINTPESKLALALGLLGPISYLCDSNSNIDNRLVNISGISSTGKTTAAKLALSLFTKPEKTVNGLYRNANGTTLSIQRTLAEGNGLTMLIDDFSAFASRSSHENEKFIYSLESAFGRSSCDLKGGVITPKTRKGAIILTSENKISDLSFKEGALVRILELSNIHWTKDANHANKINNFCNEHYGLLGPQLMQIVLNYPQQHLTEKLNIQRNKIRRNLLKNHLFDKFTDRIIDEYALVLLCVKIVEEYYQKNSLTIDEKFQFYEIFNLLMKQEEENYNMRNPYVNVYHKLIDFYVQNSKGFIYEFNGDEPNKNHVLGRIYITDSGEKAIMGLTHHGRIAFKKQYSFDLHDACLMQEFEAKGKVLFDKDKTSWTERYTQSCKINGVSIKVLRIVLPEYILKNLKGPFKTKSNKKDKS